MEGMWRLMETSFSDYTVSRQEISWCLTGEDSRNVEEAGTWTGLCFDDRILGLVAITDRERYRSCCCGKLVACR